MKGTPIPLATPTNADPMNIPMLPPTRPRNIYEMINSAGAIKRAILPMRLLSEENIRPPVKPKTSIMAITGADPPSL